MICRGDQTTPGGRFNPAGGSLSELASGVDLKATSDLLDHSTIGITADLYTHVAERLHKAQLSGWTSSRAVNRPPSFGEVRCSYGDWR